MTRSPGGGRDPPVGPGKDRPNGAGGKRAIAFIGWTGQRSVEQGAAADLLSGGKGRDRLPAGGSDRLAPAPAVTFQGGPGATGLPVASAGPESE